MTGMLEGLRDQLFHHQELRLAPMTSVLMVWSKVARLGLFVK